MPNINNDISPSIPQQRWRTGLNYGRITTWFLFPIGSWDIGRARHEVFGIHRGLCGCIPKEEELFDHGDKQ